MSSTESIIDGEAARAAYRPVTSGDTGNTVRGVERKLEALFGFDDPLVTRSASEGFLCTLLALGIGPGDEVVLPVSICHTMINATLLAGATPVLADCDAYMALSAAAARKALGPRTRCMVVHHPFGRAIDLAPFAAMRADAPGASAPGAVTLVEDCAQALGATLNEPVGHAGDVALFSFAARKPLPAGTGGMIVARDPSLRERIRHTARVGAAGYADDELLGWASSPSAADAPQLLERIERFHDDLAARLRVAESGVQMLAESVNVLSAECLHRRPPRSVFHRVIVDLPTANVREVYEAIMRRLDEQLPRSARRAAQSGIPRAPFESPYLLERYVRIGRSDLCDPTGNGFPTWQSCRWRHVYLRTDESITHDDLLAACRALLHATITHKDRGPRHAR